MEGDLDEGKEEIPKEDDTILFCLRRVNMNFDQMKMKGIAMKRRTIARFQKEQRTFKAL